MKKLLVLFLALSLVGGVAIAQDLGLTAGFELGVLDFEEAADTFYLMPSISVEINDLVDGLELSAGVALPLGLSDWEDNFWLGVDVNLRAAYNLDIAADGTVSLILESKTFIPATDYACWVAEEFGWWGFMDEIVSLLIPGIKYTHALRDMSVFGQVDVPFLLFAGYSGVDPLDWVGLNFTLGMKMDMGFGLEVLIENSIRGSWYDSGDTSFLDWVTITPSYETGPLYAELAVVIPTMDDGMDYIGITLTPEVWYQVTDALQAYLFFNISGLGSDWDDAPFFGFGAGVKFRF
jgi:hypothetical protein